MKRISLCFWLTFLMAAGLSRSWADQILYYVAVDTTNWTHVEDALRDLQKRYGITYRPATTAELSRTDPASSGASARPLVLKMDRKTRASGRIPKTEREFSELNIAARESPTACYGWIYGKDSGVVKELQGHRWSELGDDDGLQQCRAESSRVRSAQSLIGF